MSDTSDYRSSDDWIDCYDDEDVDHYWSKPNRNRTRGEIVRRSKRQLPIGQSKPERVESRNGTFRCRKCKIMVGPPISGGRHRNHCPLCLYSRHVDRSRPGDRACSCRSMMEPVGVTIRLSGEQALVHECLGCGVRRRNRVAADDNTIAVMRLAVIGADSVEDLDVRSVS